MDASSDQPTDRRGLVVLSPAECDSLLESSVVGRVAFVSGGLPIILPVNYAYHEGSVVFRTTVGEKLAAADRGDQMAFEIDGWDPATQTGWSVIVRGASERVFDADEIERLEALRVRSWAKPGINARWVRIRRSEVSGRALR